MIQNPITSITAFWRNSYINNNTFDYWSGDFVDSWTQMINDGSIGHFQMPDGIAVKMACNKDDSSKPVIEQLISGLNPAKNYTLFVKCKGNILINFDGSPEYSVSSDVWDIVEIPIIGTSSFLLALTMNDDSDMLEYAYYDLADISELDSLPMDPQKVTNIDDFEQNIEDELFTFISDSMTLTFKNYTRTGYLSPQTIIDNPGRLYRLDIVFDFEGIEKQISLFTGRSDNDLDQEENYNQNRISITAYELQSIFKEFKWYLGAIEQTEPEENSDELPEIKYVFRTGGDKHIDDIIDQTVENVQKLIISNQLPIGQYDFGANDISLSEATIQGDLRVINIIDYLIIPDSVDSGAIIPEQHRGKLFLLAAKGDNNVQVWEVRNGIDCILIHEIEGDSTINQLQYRFIHRYFGFPEEDSDVEGLYKNAVIVYLLHQPHNNNLLWYYKFNFNPDNELEFNKVSHRGFADNLNPLKLYIDLNGNPYVPEGNPNLPNNFTYTDSRPYLPNIHVPGSENALMYEPDGNNYNFNNSGLIEVFFGVYWDDTIYYSVSNFCTCSYFLYQFPHHFNLILENITFSEFLREICLTQDGTWYFTYENFYVGKTNIQFSDRRISAETSELTGNVITRSSGAKTIRFNDLKSKIYDQNKDRHVQAIKYYNQKYGYGKKSRNLEIKRFIDYSLSDKINYQNIIWIILGYSYSWEISENSIKRRTFLKLFEAVD